MPIFSLIEIVLRKIDAILNSIKICPGKVLGWGHGTGTLPVVGEFFAAFT